MNQCRLMPRFPRGISIRFARAGTIGGAALHGAEVRDANTDGPVCPPGGGLFVPGPRLRGPTNRSPKKTQRKNPASRPAPRPRRPARKLPTKGDVNRILGPSSAARSTPFRRSTPRLQQEEQTLVDKTSKSLHDIVETTPDSVARPAIQALIELQFEDEESGRSCSRWSTTTWGARSVLPLRVACRQPVGAVRGVHADRLEKATDPRAKAWGFVSLASHECERPTRPPKGERGLHPKKAEEYLEQGLKLVPEDEMEASPRPVAVRRLYILQNSRRSARPVPRLR